MPAKCPQNNFFGLCLCQGVWGLAAKLGAILGSSVTRWHGFKFKFYSVCTTLANITTQLFWAFPPNSYLHLFVWQSSGSLKNEWGPKELSLYGLYKYLATCGRQRNGPQTPRTCEYATFYGKTDYGCDYIKDPEMKEIILDYPDGSV